MRDIKILGMNNKNLFNHNNNMEEIIKDKERGIKCLFVKILVLLVPLFVLPSILLKLCPMWFFDSEYSTYLQNKEYALEHDEWCRVLIMGDSSAKSGYLPSLLSDDTYNYSLTGASPLEEYYCLLEYLQNNDSPEYLIYTAYPGSLTKSFYLWTRSVYFHRIEKDTVEDIINNSSKFSDGSNIVGFGGENVKTYELYYVYSPTKYGKALINGFSNKRFNENKSRYVEVKRNKGQIQFGNDDYCDGLNDCVSCEEFEVSEMIDYYLQEVIQLCDSYNIKFVFQNSPMNEASYTELNENFIIEYEAYLSNLQEKYPLTVIDTKLFSYGNEYFGDRYHLNKKGTEKFSLEMKEKYSYIFEAH